MAEKMRYWVDESGELEKVFNSVIEKDFPLLSHANFLFTFRNNEKTDDEDRPIVAEARKIPNKERDLYGYDFEINVHFDAWREMLKGDRKRVAWHELNHCRVRETVDGEPEYDDNERLKIYTESHDVVIKTFRAEIARFGMDDDVRAIAKFLRSQLKPSTDRKRKRKKVKK